MHRVWSGDDKRHKKVKWNIVRGADSMLRYCQRSKSFLQVLHERDESVRESIVSSEPVTHVDSLWPQFAVN